ncbi:hypothetical protein ACI3LZ_005591 [Candidozyma auris]
MLERYEMGDFIYSSSHSAGVFFFKLLAHFKDLKNFNKIFITQDVHMNDMKVFVKQNFDKIMEYGEAIFVKAAFDV